MTRQITVYESAKNGKVTVLENVDVNTLGELKTVLRANNIDYSNMDFFEGTANIKLVSDDSVLPQNIPYNGENINDLMIFLSTTNKKVNSGVTRQELYQIIRNNCLEDEIQDEFGKNFTNVSTTELKEYLEREDWLDEDTEFADDEEQKGCDEEVLVEDDLTDLLKRIVKILADKGLVSSSLELKETSSSSRFTADEIETMLQKTVY